MFVVDQGPRGVAVDGVDREITLKGRVLCLDKGGLGQESLEVTVSVLVDGCEDVLMAVLNVSFERASVTVRSIAVGRTALVRLLVLMREHVTVPRTRAA